MAKACLLVEFCGVIIEWLILFIITIIESCKNNKFTCIYICLFVYLLLYLLLNLACIICKSVFLARIIKNNFSYYCSEEITNEVLRKENEKIKKSILLIAINLAADIFVFLLGGLSLLIAFLLKKYEDYKKKKLTDNNNIQDFYKSNECIDQKNEMNSARNNTVKEETTINNGDTSQVDPHPPAKIFL